MCVCVSVCAVSVCGDCVCVCVVSVMPTNRIDNRDVDVAVSVGHAQRL